MTRFISSAIASLILTAAVLFAPLGLSAQETDGAPSVPCPAPIIPETPPESPPPEPSPVRLNEVLADPAGADEASEFIEVRNDGDIDADIAGWSIRDAAGKTFVVERSTVPAHGYLTFIYAESRITLNNEGEHLTLLRPDGTAADQISFNAHGHTGESIGRSATGDWEWSDRPTPGAENLGPSAPSPLPPPAPTPSPAPAPSEPSAELAMIAFMPDPAGSDDAEWIEIMETAGTGGSLAGWRLDDDEGGSAPFDLPGGDRIGPNAVMKVMKELSRIALNNDRDVVRLIGPDGSVKETVEYEDPPEGVAYRKIDGQWRWETIVAEPVVPPEAPVDAAPQPRIDPLPDGEEPQDDAADAPELKNDGTIELFGTVTVPPGRIGKATFLLVDDAGRGLTMRLYGKTGSMPGAGDRISVRGKYHDDERPWMSVGKNGLTILEKGGVLTYEPKEIADLSAEDAAAPVKVRGTVTAHGNRWLRLSDPDGQMEIKATFPATETIGQLSSGDTVEIPGVIRVVAGGLELLASKRHLAVIERGDKKEEEDGHGHDEIAVADRPEAREPLTLGSVEKGSRRPIYAGVAVLGTVTVAGVAWRKRKRELAEE